jgi:hypothetical protein
MSKDNILEPDKIRLQNRRYIYRYAWNQRDTRTVIDYIVTNAELYSLIWYEMLFK